MRILKEKVGSLQITSNICHDTTKSQEIQTNLVSEIDKEGVAYPASPVADSSPVAKVLPSHSYIQSLEKISDKKVLVTTSGNKLTQQSDVGSHTANWLQRNLEYASNGTYQVSSTHPEDTWYGTYEDASGLKAYLAYYEKTNNDQIEQGTVLADGTDKTTAEPPTFNNNL